MTAASVDTATCALCGLPAGRDPISQLFSGVTQAFCCAGCLNVYAILSESGLATGDFRDSDLFRESLSLGLIANAKTETAPPPETAERRESVYQLSGLWCASCGWLIEHALRRQQGVVSAEVLFTSDLLKIVYCPQYVPTGRIEECVASLGYTAAPYTGETEPARREQRDLLLRLGVAAALWMNVMLFSLVVYASYFDGIADWARRTVPLVLMFLATPAIFYSGWPILHIAWQGLRRGMIRMETLIATGVLSAYFYSAAQIFHGQRHFYFDTACAIVTLVLAGKVVERGAKARSAKALSTLHRMLPKKARVMADDRERFVNVDALIPGMLLLIKPGERIPADGIVVTGASSVEESIITGESKPQEKSAGDSVIGGSLNGAGVLTIRVSRQAAESTLAQIVKSVESALAARTETERLVDRISRFFVPAVLAIAAAVFLICIALGTGAIDAMMRSIAVLVIACPCALGIATPLAITAAVGAASRAGILFRHPAALESIRTLNTVVLDKTGTATEGRFRLHESWSESWSRGDVLDLLAALERFSEHPLADAIVNAASDSRLPVTGITIHKGCGIAGSVAGRRVAAGSRAMMKLREIALDDAAETRAAAWENASLTVVFCAIDGELAGMFALGDQPRSDAAALVSEFRREGVRVALLSGDAPQTTAQIANQLGIADFAGGIVPQGKADYIQQLRSRGEIVAMVGDGINDAPALATADLGIAMGSGADIATQSAPVVILGDSLMKIAEVLKLARRTHRIIRANLFWAFFYNIIGISLAATGALTPILSAAAMVLSSLCVIANSQRLSHKR